MTGNRSLELPPEELRELLRSGKMVILKEPKPPKPEREKPEEENLMINMAKEILGPDFLGEEAVRDMEEKLRGVGVNVEFVTRENGNLPSFPYTREDLELAKTNGEMLVLRPQEMITDEGDVPLTFSKFLQLSDKDPLGKKDDAFPRLVGVKFWYDSEPFATDPEQIKLGWALVKKEVLDCSLNKTWDNQEQLLRQYEAYLIKKGAKSATVQRRTATEVAWDTILYYLTTGESLLEKVYDWGKSYTTLRGYRVPVFVGCFDSQGLEAHAGPIGRRATDIGVCPCR